MTWWHVTYDPKFSIDPAYPVYHYDREEPGILYVTQHPKQWMDAFPGRTYAAEIEFPPEAMLYQSGEEARIDANQAHVKRVVKMSSEPSYVQPYLQRLNPDEVHGAGGDCKNPYCNYQFTADDRKEIYHNEGYFTCPKCDMTFDYNTSPGDHLVTRLGLTPTQMGDIGEDIVDNMVNIPGVGPVVWRHDTPQSPLDFVIGQYGVEVKTNHSEAQPRFKLGGSYERGQKIQKAMEMGLTPALIGVRLNFYRDKADLFFRPQMSDTWIGQSGLEHIGQVDFSDLNPFRRPEDVPPASDLPDDDGG